LSCHGDESGVELSDGDALTWAELAEVLKPLAQSDRLLVMASCSGGNPGLTRALALAGATYGYVFGSNTDPKIGVSFTHSCLAWSVLYNGLIEKGVTPQSARTSINRMNEVVKGDFVYRRWDGKAFRRYAGKPKSGTLSN
jgi:hypothetical protein